MQGNMDWLTVNDILLSQEALSVIAEIACLCWEKNTVENATTALPQRHFSLPFGRFNSRSSKEVSGHATPRVSPTKSNNSIWQ
jgi:hypothetical protein